MAGLLRVTTAVGYTFAAWLLAALLIYAAAAPLPGLWGLPVRCAALLATFGPVFSVYFRGRRPLPPAAAAGVAIAFLAALDLALVARHLPRPASLYLRFWDWQVPAACVAATVYGSGRRALARASSAAQKIL